MTCPINISVVIPAYNAAQFLPRSLASVYSQTLPAAEVIVVDDGSTDDSAAIARGFGATVISKGKGGVSAARNTGVRAASGDWIAFLDADDRWAAEKLVIQTRNLRENTVLSYTGIRIFDDSGVRQTCPACDVSYIRKSLRFENCIAPSAVLAKRTALLQEGGFRDGLQACEDWDLWFRLQRRGEFEAVPDALTDYYVHPSSASTDPNRMLYGFQEILDTTLVSDLHGISRRIWARRARAVQLYSAGMIARDNGLRGEIGYILQSLAAWPSPWWKPHRFAGLAASLRQRLRRSGAQHE